MQLCKVADWQDGIPMPQPCMDVAPDTPDVYS